MTHKTILTFSGCRLNHLWFKDNEEHSECIRLKQEIDHQIRRAMFRGAETFLFSAYKGVDIWFGEIFIEIRKEFPNLKLICVTPYETLANNWNEKWRERYFYVMENSNEEICLQAKFSPGCVQNCQRYMIDGSSMLMVVPETIGTGVASQASEYAEKRGIEIITVAPWDLSKAC